MRRSWTKVVLFNFLVAAVMGLLLRMVFIWEISWIDYRNWLHGHSHVALLGWAYLLSYALMVDRLVPKGKQNASYYQRLFYITQLSVLGMMVSFPIEGYGPVSISFSTIHIVGSYFFVYGIWRDMRTGNQSLNYWFRMGLCCMVISTLGVLAIGPIMALIGKGSMLYQAAIQFYLHFQFNGWFLTVAIGLLMIFIGQQKFKDTGNKFRLFLGLYVASILLTYFHILFWAYGHSVFYLLNSAGVLFQAIAVGMWIGMFWKSIKVTIDGLEKIAKYLFYFGLFSLSLKVLLQIALITPFAVEMSTTVRPLIVGYIHLFMIGAVSAWGLLMLYHWLKVDYPVWALACWLLGFLGTEALLFVQGGMYAFRLGAMPAYHEILWAASCLLVLGVAGQLVYLLFNKRVLLNKQLLPFT
ncbi:hypothetical protein KZP23_22140 [Echinicola marina]|uniref:hypothetical protein n=1 Tax=Echinicola marina TaxID=2859768 RepID=UPI001CF6AC39|nr:hypothetical protein [Echinicola marina]UCS93313.1 hypothetical protein KZP23_22140 [Echinicola marina]